MKRVCALAALLGLPFVLRSDVNVSQDSTHADTEPSIAVNPLDRNNVIAGWMRSTWMGVDIQSRASWDSGRTWGNVTKFPHVGRPYHSADVHVVFDRKGTAYLCYIDFQETARQGDVAGGGVIYFSRSRDGGATWSKPVVARGLSETPDQAIDRPWMAVDTSGGPRDGCVYLTTHSPRSYRGTHHLHLKSSSDGGATWSSDILVDDAPFPSAGPIGGNAAVGKDGMLYVVYTTVVEGEPSMIVAASSDGGESFSRTRALAYHPFPPYRPGQNLAADPAREGHLAVTWVDGRDGTPQVYLSRSMDSGFTWSAPARIGGDAGIGVIQDFPWLAYAKDGRLAAAWRDRRLVHGAPATSFDVYCAVSEDGGATFSPSRRLSDETSPASPPVKKGNDFIGVTSSNGRLFAAWGDYREGNWEVLVGSVPLP